MQSFAESENTRFVCCPLLSVTNPEQQLQILQ